MRRRHLLAVAFVLVAGAVAVVFAAAGDAKTWTRTYGGRDGGPFSTRVLTPEYHDGYGLTSSGGRLTAAAPASNRGTLTFKLWLPGREGEPAWDDPGHTRKTTIPRGYRSAGKTGWYVGHIRPGGLIRYGSLGIWSHH